MARKNSNAGQPNRAAQITRRADRRYKNEQHRPFRDDRVMGPGSENISPQKQPREVQTTIEFVVAERETVAA